LKRRDWEQWEEWASIATKLVERGEITVAGSLAKTIMELSRLPDARIAEVADFVAFIRHREEEHEEQRQWNWQTTVEAMEAAERGELVTVGDIDGLMADLHADD
jgi:hypothetical protein